MKLRLRVVALALAAATPLAAQSDRVILAIGDEDFVTTEPVVAATPAWNPDAGVAPLSTSEAIRIARSWLKKRRPADAEAAIESVGLHRIGPTRHKDRWFYLLSFGQERPGGKAKRFDLALLLDRTVVGPDAKSGSRKSEATEIAPKEAQQALLRLMEAHPDAFAGFTSGLEKSAARVNLSEDGKTAYVGRISVDLVEGTFAFKSWSEHEGGKSAVEITWSGRFVKRDGRLEATVPSALEERFVAH